MTISWKTKKNKQTKKKSIFFRCPMVNFCLHILYLWELSDLCKDFLRKLQMPKFWCPRSLQTFEQLSNREHADWKHDKLALVVTERLYSGVIKTSSVPIYQALVVFCEVSGLKGYPSHSLFTLLPTGKRNSSICCHTTRLQRSFFPLAETLLTPENFYF